MYAWFGCIDVGVERMELEYRGARSCDGWVPWV